MAPRSKVYPLNDISPVTHAAKPPGEGETPVEAVLTPRQAEILDFIKSYLKEYGFPPTIREMAKHFKMSAVASIQDHLERMKERGVIRHHPGKARAIVVLDNVQVLVAEPRKGGSR